MTLYAGSDKVCAMFLKSTATLIDKTITENGEYKAIDENADGYSSVNVDVESVNNQDKTITENGEYTADEGYSGLGTVTVNVESVNNQDKNINENGTYTADPGYSGLGTVNVNVLGIGDTINVKNYSGNNIEVGDKIWINPKTRATASSIAVYNSSSVPALTPGGEYVYYSTKRYNVNDNTTTNTSIVMISNLASQACILRYGINNSLHYGPYRLYPTEMNDDRMYVQGYYMTSRTTDTSFSNIYLYKIDSEYNILKTWTITGYSQYAYYILTVIGNKLYMGSGNNKFYMGNIDENSDTVELSSINIGQVLYSTKDDKIAIVGNHPNGSYGSLYNNIRFYYINDDYTITDNFMTANEDLINICSNTELLITFNQNNGVLCLSKYGIYGAFKYNEELKDFETISLVLNDTSGASSVGWYLMTMSSDLTKLQYGNKLYTLEQADNYTYNAIPYSAITQNSFSGIAKEDILQNESGEVYVGTVVGSDLKRIIVRNNGNYTPTGGYDGFSEVDVGVGQVGETYEAENLTGHTINQYDKVWLNYRQNLIGEIYNNNYIDGNGEGNFYFICDKTSSNLYYDIKESGTSIGQKYDLINNEISDISKIGMPSYKGGRFTYLENDTPAIIHKTQIYNDDYSTIKATENGIIQIKKQLIGYDCYIMGNGNEGGSGYFYFPDGVRANSDNFPYGKVWKYLDNYYFATYLNYREKIYLLNFEEHTLTEVFNSYMTHILDGITRSGFTSDEKYLVCFSSEKSVTNGVKIVKLNYSNEVCTPSLVQDNLLPETIKSLLTGYSFSWFNPQNNTLIVAPLNIHNINEILICKYNPSLEIFEDITSEVSLPNSPITLTNYYYDNAIVNMWISTDYKILIFANASSSNRWLNVYYMDNTEGWVITTYNNTNQDSITGYAAEEIQGVSGTKGNVIVGSLLNQ